MQVDLHLVALSANILAYGKETILAKEDTKRLQREVSGMAFWGQTSGQDSPLPKSEGCRVF